MKLRELITSLPVFFVFSCLFILCSLVFGAMLSFVRGGEADLEAIAFETFVKIIIIVCFLLLIVKFGTLLFAYDLTSAQPHSRIDAGL